MFHVHVVFFSILQSKFLKVMSQRVRNLRKRRIKLEYEQGTRIFNNDTC